MTSLRFASRLSKHLRPRYLSTSAPAAAPSSSTSLALRIALFSTVSLSLGGGAVGYTLVSNESNLFWARDNYPAGVNFIAPLLGLPQEPVIQVNSDEKEEEEVTDIKQVVGETTHVCVKFSSGFVQIVECGSEETPGVLTYINYTLLCCA
jgi:hypothetical protein